MGTVTCRVYQAFGTNHDGGGWVPSARRFRAGPEAEPRDRGRKPTWAQGIVATPYRSGVGVVGGTRVAPEQVRLLLDHLAAGGESGPGGAAGRGVAWLCACVASHPPAPDPHSSADRPRGRAADGREAPRRLALSRWTAGPADPRHAGRRAPSGPARRRPAASQRARVPRHRDPRWRRPAGAGPPSRPRTARWCRPARPRRRGCRRR
jgi:hypothetical protein